MIQNKFFSFRKRIFTYCILFVVLVAFILLMGLMKGYKNSPLFVKVISISYFAESNCSNVSIKIRLTFKASGGKAKIPFSFPLLLPEDVKLNKVYVDYPYKTPDPVLIRENTVYWKGYQPEKGKPVTFTIRYDYHSNTDMIILPFKKVGFFNVRKSLCDAHIILNEKILEFNCNYELSSRQKDFKTYLSYNGNLTGTDDNLTLKW